MCSIWRLPGRPMHHAVPLVDLYAGGYAGNWEYVSLDGFHPSNEGHAKIAELYLEILLKRPITHASR